MLKMMIVDDERKTIEGIMECLNWASYQIDIVGQARNGRDAMEIAERVIPDIVLTDIRMPIMDGIEFSKALRQIHPQTKIIFITGYSDLEYMKTAFKEGVIDYILKPIDIEELEHVISKTTELCKIEKKKEQYREEMEAKLRESIPLLQDKFLSLLVLGEMGRRETILEKMDFLAIDLPHEGNYLVFVINIDDYLAVSSEKSQFEMHLLSIEMITLIRETLFGKGIVFELAEGELAGIIHFQLSELEYAIAEEIETFAQTTQMCLNRQMNLSVTFGIGEWVNRIEKVSFSYFRAMHAANQKLYMGKNQIIYADKATAVNERETAVDYKIYEQVYTALRGGNMEKAQVRIDEAFDHVSKSGPLNYAYVQSVCLQFTAIIHRLYAENSDNVLGGQVVDAYELTNKLFKLETIDDMKLFVLANCKKVCEFVAARQNTNSNKIIEHIKYMIHQRYAENLSIDLIAKEVFLSPAYTCLLFKQESGETINGYLTHVRIEKAKELLRQGTSKLYEICLEVGYSDPKYFSKLFKKMTGFNPSEYK